MTFVQRVAFVAWVGTIAALSVATWITHGFATALVAFGVWCLASCFVACYWVLEERSNAVSK